MEEISCYNTGDNNIAGFDELTEGPILDEFMVTEYIEGGSIRFSGFSMAIDDGSNKNYDPSNKGITLFIQQDRIGKKQNRNNITIRFNNADKFQLFINYLQMKHDLLIKQNAGK